MGIRKRIALLSDIHGNYPALMAVLNDIKEHAIDEIIVAGDMVGRGPEGDKCVRELRRVTDSFIGGNHEEYLVSFREGNIPKEWLTLPEWAASRWMAAELSEETLGFIRALPFSTTSRVIPDLRVVHGSPFSNREGIGPWTPPDRLKEHLNSIEERNLICAHTHRPFDCSLDEGRIINIGSVGLPFNGDRHAQYVWLEWEDHELSLVRRKVSYDVQETLEVYAVSGFIDGGKVTAELLAIELRDARPALVPYEQWLRNEKLPYGDDSMNRFLSTMGVERINWSAYSRP